MTPAIPREIAALFIREPCVDVELELSHPGGTVRAAAELARASSAAVPVRALAQHISRNVASDLDAPEAIAAWIRAHLTYRMETPGLEVLSGPISTVRAGGGDCDDLSILHSSLCLAIGIDCYPTAMGRHGRWYHMVSWAPPGPPYELSLSQFYGGPTRIPRTVEEWSRPPFEFLAWDAVRGGFIRPAPRVPCPTCLP